MGPEGPAHYLKGASMATLSNSLISPELSAVSADNWRERVRFWSLLCLDNGWTGKAKALLEVGRAELFGHTVDDEVCVLAVARHIGDIYDLARMEGVSL